MRITLLPIFLTSFLPGRLRRLAGGESSAVARTLPLRLVWTVGLLTVMVVRPAVAPKVREKPVDASRLLVGHSDRCATRRLRRAANSDPLS